MKNAVIYIHGKGGNAEEVSYYKKFFNENFDLIGFDYKSDKPWEAKEEFREFFDSIIPKYRKIILIANSLGAYFSLIFLSNKPIEKAMFISPIVDMERLILDIMNWASVSEEELRIKKEIDTSFGDPLSWEYLSYVRENHINWDIPTSILFGENDNMTSIATMKNFASNINSNLMIMKEGEHWFHTKKQMDFLDKWFESNK